MKRRKRARGDAVRQIEVVLHAQACSGQGVGRSADGEVVLVDDGIRGERVQVRAERRRGATQGKLVKLLEASPQRRTPDCEYATRCGGCDWMHIDDEAQLRFQRESLTELLQRQGLAEVPEVVVHRDKAVGYRERVRLGLRARRGRVTLGYRKKRSHDLVDIERCLVLTEALNKALLCLRQWLEGSEGQGEAALALSLDGRAVVDLSWSGTLAAEAFERADAAVKEGRIAGVRLWQEGVRTPAQFGDARPCFEAADGQPLRIAAGGFAQPSTFASVTLATAVARLVAELEVPSAVELFAGSGTLTVALAAHAAKLVAVEQDADALEQLRHNLALRSLQVTSHCDDANAFKIPRSCHTLVLDPPRAGAAGAMVNAIEARVKQIIYVACDPFTLARDIRVLVKAGYRLSHVEMMSIFPQTHHFETVVRLVR